MPKKEAITVTGVHKNPTNAYNDANNLNFK